MVSGIVLMQIVQVMAIIIIFCFCLGIIDPQGIPPRFRSAPFPSMADMRASSLFLSTGLSPSEILKLQQQHRAAVAAVQASAEAESNQADAAPDDEEEEYEYEYIEEEVEQEDEGCDGGEGDHNDQNQTQDDDVMVDDIENEIIRTMETPAYDSRDGQAEFEKASKPEDDAGGGNDDDGEWEEREEWVEVEDDEEENQEGAVGRGNDAYQSSVSSDTRLEQPPRAELPPRADNDNDNNDEVVAADWEEDDELIS
jgi:hypothetical protein